MNKKRFLSHVLREIQFVFDRKSIEEELSMHIEESIADLMEEGFSMEEAEEHAVARMGDAKEVGRLLNKEHNPVLGYLWMTTRLLIIVLAIMSSYHVVKDTYDLWTPVTLFSYKNEAIFPIRETYELPTHILKIDNICKNEHGEFYLTYRGILKFGYSRGGGTNSLFELQNYAGGAVSLNGSIYTNSFAGIAGTEKFNWPKDNRLYLECRDGHIIEIDLEEYSYAAH